MSAREIHGYILVKCQLFNAKGKSYLEANTLLKGRLAERYKKVSYRKQVTHQHLLSSGACSTLYGM